MEAAAQLTPGAVEEIANGAVPAAIQPVLQVRCVAATKSGNTSANPNPNPIPSERERYRLILSDDVNARQAILATAFNPFVRDGLLRAGTFVNLNEFIFGTIRDKRDRLVQKLPSYERVWKSARGKDAVLDPLAFAECRAYF